LSVEHKRRSNWQAVSEQLILLNLHPTAKRGRGNASCELPSPSMELCLEIWFYFCNGFMSIAHAVPTGRSLKNFVNSEESGKYPRAPNRTGWNNLFQL